ncbi:hypothetical protein [Caenispirillum bisanense]|uniref:Uncharacterized protein n=1 Tax=Caenispirillum bisanense TaxID=414052 RepID=A0A286GUA5_9PROT|nr:hypothetical protein [Caenispirillum bisanense]SOD98564.1 hypothetical protein SAMN05421508_10810 [Caenispirillum bisanense]
MTLCPSFPLRPRLRLPVWASDTGATCCHVAVLGAGRIGLTEIPMPPLTVRRDGDQLVAHGPDDDGRLQVRLPAAPLMELSVLITWTLPAQALLIEHDIVTTFRPDAGGQTFGLSGLGTLDLTTTPPPPAGKSTLLRLVERRVLQAGASTIHPLTPASPAAKLPSEGHHTMGDPPCRRAT